MECDAVGNNESLGLADHAGMGPDFTSHSTTAVSSTSRAPPNNRRVLSRIENSIRVCFIVFK